MWIKQYLEQKCIHYLKFNTTLRFETYYIHINIDIFIALAMLIKQTKSRFKRGCLLNVACTWVVARANTGTGVSFELGVGISIH